MIFKNLKLLAALTVLNSTGLFAAADTMSAPTATTPAKTAVTPMTTGSAATPKADAPIDMKKVSEAFGHFIGRHLKSPGVNFDLDSVIKGLREGSEGKPAPMSDKEYEQMMIQIQKSAFEKVSQDNLKAAEEYIQKNGKSAGIVEVKPGKLFYEVLKQGTGEAVKPNGSPQINYTGKFIDGTAFGSSEESGGPVTIPLDQTIPGFSLGIAGMKEGEKRRLIVHPELGYGTNGHLPPNSLLIFEIEVIKADSPDNDHGSDNDVSPLALADDVKGSKNAYSKDYDEESDEDDDEDYGHHQKAAPKK
jgi:peptidylprolyl isomerase